MAPILQDSFWERMGLQETDRERCIRVMQDVYARCRIEELKDQGYCSFTLTVERPGPQVSVSSNIFPDLSIDDSSSTIVQIRPHQHTLDITITQAALRTYRSFAPAIHALDYPLPGGLQAFEMDRMRGVPFKKLQQKHQMLDPRTRTKQVNLVRSFAQFIACGWPSAPPHLSRSARADSPMAPFDTDIPTWLLPCEGNVGRNIMSKLTRLKHELPTQALRTRAAETVRKLAEVQDFPVVLCHGDLIPSNILVDPDTWDITGVVDWAEAEYLPFGTCLYGLELLLGYLSPCSAESPLSFRYYNCADELRRIFWQTLMAGRPGVDERRTDVLLMRDLGVFLWWGYAWDEGRIDRVVNEVDDAEEVACLTAFLGVHR